MGQVVPFSYGISRDKPHSRKHRSPHLAADPLIASPYRSCHHGIPSKPTSWRITIIETKGGEDRKRDEHKYAGLGEYAKLEEMRDLGVRCSWVEVTPKGRSISDPTNKAYDSPHS